MKSRGFYSFYVFVLVAFIGLAIFGYFAGIGRSKTEGAMDHMAIQMEIFASNLSDLGKACLKKYSLSQCQQLEFDLNGYRALFVLSHCKEDVCVADLLVEKISPLDSNLLRHTKREIWNLKNLKQSAPN